jgi:hypothetical protein
LNSCCHTGVYHACDAFQPSHLEFASGWYLQFCAHSAAKRIMLSPHYQHLTSGTSQSTHGTT